MTRITGKRAIPISIVVALVCFGLVLRQVDLASALSTLAQLEGPILLLPFAAFLANVTLRARRWETIFPAALRPGFWSCLSVLGIGNMANYLLPGRAGDLARCVLIRRADSIMDGSRALGTLAVEKVLDGLALAAMLLIAIWATSPPPWVVNLLWSSGVLFGGALMLMIVLRHRRNVLLDALDRGSRLFAPRAGTGRLRGPLASFAEGLAAVSSPVQLVQLALMTAAIWATEAALIWGLALAFGLDVSLKSAVVVSAALGLAMMVPAAPAGLGSYELAGVAALQMVGVGASSALTLTIAIHAWVFVTNTGLGLSLLGIRGMRFGQLREGLKGDQATT